MRPRYRTWLWLLLLGLTPQTGCVTLQETPATPPPQPAAMQTLPAQPLAAFHDAEAEGLCLNAAAKFEEKGCYSEAAAQLEKARKANPKLDVCHRLALLYEALEMYPEALAEYNKELAAAKQDDVELLNNILAKLKKLVGQPVAPSKEVALLNDIGYCLYLKHDYAASAKYLNQALEMNPDYAAAWTNLGFTLAALNHIEESLNAFQHATTPAGAYCNVAFEQLKEGKFVEGKESYRQALELDPKNEMARKALTELEQIEKKDPALSDMPPAPGRAG